LERLGENTSNLERLGEKTVGKVGQKQVERLKTSMVTPVIPRVYTGRTPIVNFKSPVIPKVPLISMPKTFNNVKGKKGKKLSLGFSVVSKVKGKKKVLAVGVPKNIALAIGRGFTERTTARSFTIKPMGYTTKTDIGQINLSQYRSPKLGGRVFREGFTFVEKSRFAINTPTEKAQLKLGRKLKSKVF